MFLRADLNYQNNRFLQILCLLFKETVKQAEISIVLRNKQQASFMIQKYESLILQQKYLTNQTQKMEVPMQQSLVFQITELYKLNPQQKQNNYLKPTEINTKKQRKPSQVSNTSSWKQVQKKLKLKDYICLVNASSKVKRDIENKNDKKTQMKSKYKFDSQKIQKVIIQQIQDQFSNVLNKLNLLKKQICQQREESKPHKLKKKLSHVQKAGKIAVLYDIKHHIKQKLMKQLCQIQQLYESVKDEIDILEHGEFKTFQLQPIAKDQIERRRV